MDTYLEKLKKNKYADRQNTKWAKEIAGKCKHEWQPVSFSFELETVPDLNKGRVYCVCMKCCSHSYIETGYVGYYLNSPDLLEEDDER